MSGGVLIVHAETPELRRAARLTVSIDGAKAGEVLQGTAESFPLPAGRHTVRVERAQQPSKEIAVEIAEGGEFVVRAACTGFAMLSAVIPVFAVFGLIPGVTYRLEALGTPPPAPASSPGRDPKPEAAAPAGALWWEADPLLAKRVRKQSS